MINALVAIKDSSVLTIKQIVRDARAELSSPGGSVTAQQKKALAIARNLYDEQFASVTIAGTVYRLFDLLLSPGELEKLDEVVPGSVVAGAWNKDGTQYGQMLELERDSEGKAVFVVRGTPVYPIHPRLLDFMPDDVEHNADGTEKSRKRPTQLKQVHKYLGWADRRWT